jgi:ribosomal protein S18 acetylase RimI-like enzyme
MSTIEEVERRSVRAVPPVETIVIDGWHVGIGRGQVNRMNSTTTFGIVPWEPLDTIEAVERRYASRHRPPSFRLTELDAELDDLLFGRGYEKSLEVIVMTAPAGGARDNEVTMLSAATPGWIEALGRLGEYSDLRVAEIGESLAGLAHTHGAFRIGDRAVGLAVVDDGWVGLFDIAVAPETRRQGLGSRISTAMLDWSAGQGAAHAYLQVLASNAPALGLYEKLGFEEAYRYWYRTKD